MDNKKKHDQVSTVLCLWDPTWPTFSTNQNKKRKAQARDHDDDDQLASTASSSSKQRGKVLVSPMPPALLELFPPSVTPSVNHKIIINGNGTTTNKNIMTMTKNTQKQEQQLNRIHPKMLAAHLNRIDAWGIEKTLTARDLQTHLHLPANSMASHVMSYVDDKFKRGVLESRVGAQVIVHDCDTGSTHLQSIVRVRHVPGTTSSYVFAGLKWLPGFVRRRKLRAGDRIGLHWLRKLSKPVFLFSVVQRASPQPTTPPHQALPILIDCY